MLIIGLVFAFILSNIGWWELLRRRAGIENCFLPLVTIAFQFTILFFAGLLNLLELSTYTVEIIGIIIFLWFFFKERSFEFLINYLSVEYIYMLLVMCIVVVSLCGKLFTHYDNFSHWALVVKRMIETNRFPNFQDSSVVLYTEYPLGSATYVYFFCKCVGVTESIQMIAQAYMMITAIMPLFHYVRQRRILNFIIIIVLSYSLLVLNIRLTGLLVDSLLPEFP